MDVFARYRSYIENVLKSSDGPKILLLDDEVSKMIGLVYTQIELLDKEVVLVCSLSKTVKKPVDQALTGIQCIIVIRPTHDNVRDLLIELNSPHYGSYNIYFTNTLNPSNIQQIAYSDHMSKVTSIQEIFLDTFALNKRLLSLGMSQSLKGLIENSDTQAMTRIIEGLTSIFASLKIRPQIRYENASQLCRKIAERFQSHVSQHKEYFKSREQGTLLIVDRRSDAINCVVHGWTYQELISDQLDFENNIVKLGDEFVVVDERTDDFFAKNMYASYGALGEAVHGLTQGITKKPEVSDVKDVDQLKNFLRDYQKYQREAGVAAKHVKLLSACSELVKGERLMDLSKIEQAIAVESDLKGHLAQTLAALNDPRVGDENALRLGLVFCLKYEGSAEAVAQVKSALSARSAEFPAAVERFQALFGARYGGRERNGGVLGLISSHVSSILGMGDEAENLCMRYRPRLEETLRKLRDGRLDEFPTADGSQPPPPAQRVIVLIVGGATYAEGRVAYQSPSGFDVVVCGTSVISPRGFVRQLLRN